MRNINGPSVLPWTTLHVIVKTIKWFQITCFMFKNCCKKWLSLFNLHLGQKLTQFSPVALKLHQECWTDRGNYRSTKVKYIHPVQINWVGNNPIVTIALPTFCLFADPSKFAFCGQWLYFLTHDFILHKPVEITSLLIYV